MKLDIHALNVGNTSRTHLKAQSAEACSTSSWEMTWAELHCGQLHPPRSQFSNCSEPHPGPRPDQTLSLS